MLRQRQPREKDEKHLRFIAGLSCLICGGTDVQAAHIRYPDHSAGKRATGMAEKPDDCFTVPLCVRHHALQHAYGDERSWWENLGVDPIKVSLRLYSVTGKQERAAEILGSIPVVYATA